MPEVPANHAGVVPGAVLHERPLEQPRPTPSKDMPSTSGSHEALSRRKLGSCGAGAGVPEKNLTMTCM